MLVNKSIARIKYERRTKTLIRSLKARQISRRECMRELDAAFERFLAPNADELFTVRALVLDNNNAVMQEMTARSADRKVSRGFKDSVYRRSSPDHSRRSANLSEPRVLERRLQAELDGSLIDTVASGVRNV